MKRGMRVAVSLVALILLGAACGGESPRQTPTRPQGPAPTVPGVSVTPPPAWVETASGDRWLAFFSYCWSTQCVDSRPADQRADIPSVAVMPGEVVRFHLGFDPSEVELSVGPKTYVLASERVTSWKVTGPGGLAFLTAKGKPGSAGYVMRLLVR